MTKFYLLIFVLLISFPSYSQCDPTSVFANDSTNAFCFEEINPVRKCYTNNIPSHDYGPFGGNNTIEGQDFDYSMCLYPELGMLSTPLKEDPSSQGCGNGIIFGVSAGGVNYSPFARLYWVNPNTMEENLNFHIEADFTLNMDLNGGHVNAASRYHYHNIPKDHFANNLNIDGMSHSPIVGYAADGFPIYYKYLYTDANNPASGISAFQSSYALKSGERPGDGISAPGGAYDGNYVEDYEYLNPLSELDECGGRFAVSPEYPNGIYYYVLTDNWPYIPRCLNGEYVDNSFRLGQNCPNSTAMDDCTIGTATSTDDLSYLKAKVYPNPASEYVMIDLGNSIDGDRVKRLKLYRSDATVVFSSTRFVEKIELNEMNKGTYFLQIDFEDGQLTKKIIIH